MNKTIIDYNTLLSLNNELDYPFMNRWLIKKEIQEVSDEDEEE
jgi:hypothetical protein